MWNKSVKEIGLELLFKLIPIPHTTDEPSLTQAMRVLGNSFLGSKRINYLRLNLLARKNELSKSLRRRRRRAMFFLKFYRGIYISSFSDLEPNIWKGPQSRRTAEIFQHHFYRNACARRIDYQRTPDFDRGDDPHPGTSTSMQVLQRSLSTDPRGACLVPHEVQTNETHNSRDGGDIVHPYRDTNLLQQIAPLFFAPIVFIVGHCTTPSRVDRCLFVAFPFRAARHGLRFWHTFR